MTVAISYTQHTRLLLLQVFRAAVAVQCMISNR